MIPLNKKDGKSYLLMNKHNKFMSSRSLNVREVEVVQSNCNPEEKRQLWNWNGDGLSNYNDQFMSKVPRGKTFDNATKKHIPFYKIHLQPNPNSLLAHQTWKTTSVGQMVSSDGSCLGVENDSDFHDAILSIGSCDKKEKSQFWSFTSIWADATSTSRAQLIEFIFSDKPTTRPIQKSWYFLFLF